MQALILRAYHEFALEDVPTPEPGPEEVLVAVQACGICGSDVHGMDGSTGRRQPPIIMGHEAAGTIAALGEGASAWTVGERVTFDSTISCGRCAYCRSGRINLCSHRRVLGVSCDEYRRDGAFAEYIAVPQHILYRVPEGLPLEHAAMVEPVSVAVHAVERSPLKLGDTAVVVGAGMIGLLIVQALRARGCGRIVSVDVDASRLALARQLGADEALAPQEAQDMIRGDGADLVVDAVGSNDSLQSAIGLVRKGGAVMLVGNIAPQVTLPLQSVVTRELSLLGCCASAGEYPACLELMQRGAVQVAPLISAVAPLAEGPEWFKRLHAREPGLVKAILQPIL